MNTEETQAMKRLLKKLSALRATLSDDERAILDGFILTPNADEVAAHVFDASTTKTPAKTPAADEVAAHVFDASTAKTPAKTPAADEVAAHVFSPGMRKNPRLDVVFDPEKEIYRIA